MINCIPDTDLTNACLEKIESESSLEQIESEHWPRRRHTVQLEQVESESSLEQIESESLEQIESESLE